MDRERKSSETLGTSFLFLYDVGDAVEWTGQLICHTVHYKNNTSDFKHITFSQTFYTSGLTVLVYESKSR